MDEVVQKSIRELGLWLLENADDVEDVLYVITHKQDGSRLTKSGSISSSDSTMTSHERVGRLVTTAIFEAMETVAGGE